LLFYKIIWIEKKSQILFFCSKLPEDCNIWLKILDDVLWELLVVELWLLLSSWIKLFEEIFVVRPSGFIISGLVIWSSLLSLCWFWKSFCSEIFVSKVKNDVSVVVFDDDSLTLLLLLFVFANSKPALGIGLNVFWKLLPTVNWLSGWSSDASGLGGVVNIWDIRRWYKCDDGDIVPAGVVDDVFDSLIDLFCSSSSKSCGLESSSAKKRRNNALKIFSE